MMTRLTRTSSRGARRDSAPNPAPPPVQEPEERVLLISETNISFEAPDEIKATTSIFEDVSGRIEIAGSTDNAGEYEVVESTARKIVVNGRITPEERGPKIEIFQV